MSTTSRVAVSVVTAMVVVWLGPHSALGGYQDGMNRYEYVRSAPATGVDPTGRWRVERSTSDPHAKAVAEKGDTIDSLARKIHLDPSEWRKCGRSPQAQVA